MAENIDSLSIQLSANAGRAASNIDSLANRLSRLGGSSRNASSGMEVLNDQMEHAAPRTVDAGNNIRTFGNRLRSVIAPLRSFGTTVGNAITRNLRSAVGAVGNFVNSIARIAKYRFIRSLVKDMGQSFKDLYGYSKLFGTSFSRSMDSVTTSMKYFQNSIAAMVAPLIDLFAPALDLIIDKVVELMNWFNQLFAAISGASTYTVAKKIKVSWDSTFDDTSKKAKKTANDIKRTILGFDEINKLTAPKDTSSSGSTGKSPYSQNYDKMFETKPLTGFFKDLSNVTKNWPDWLKWLLGIGTVAGVAAGIKLLPKLLGSLLSKLKDLIALKLPAWLSNLFGGKGGSAGGAGNYDVNVDLKKGDWGPLDELKNATALVPVGLQHWGWDNIQDWIGNSATVAVALKHWGWDNINDWIGNAVTVAVALKRWGWGDLADWIGHAVTVSVALTRWGWDNLEDWIGRAVTVHVGLRKWGWDNLADWTGASDGLLVNVGLSHWGWSNLKDWIGAAVTVYVGLHKWGWKDIKSWIGNKVTVSVGLAKDGWDTIEEWIGTHITVNVSLNRFRWTTLGKWTEADSGLKVGISLVKKGWTTLGKWTEADSGLKVGISLVKKGWTTLGGWIGTTASVRVNLYRGNWDNLSSWIGKSVTVKVNLRMNGGSINASGGGGGTSGGGSGFSRRASGGIYSATTGLWNSVPKYAGGTSSAHGSMFLAGENGPEILGHLGGRTEILNQSQLAATMYASVSHAMLPAVSALVSIGNAVYQSGVSGASADEFMNGVRDAVSEAMTRQTELLREQNALLSQINEKDFSTEITTAQVNRAMQRTNRRAGTTVAAVG